jgi:hypothetical protein
MDEPKLVRMKVSPKQMSRLRNGHKVRVKPAMEGEGVCVIVNPANYDLITRTFSRNKGMELALSPQELLINQENSTQMEGQGIFGKRFDRGLKKLIGKKAVRELYGTAEQFLPLAQAGLTAGLASGATALGAVQPELIPFLPAGVAGLSALGSDYLANPSKYQSNAGGSRAKLAKDLAGRYLQDQALSSLNAQLGTNMGDLSRASIQDAITNKALAELNAKAVAERKANEMSAYERALAGSGLGLGLYAGNGLYLGASGRGLSRTGGAVGVQGGLVQSQPPALRSQPFGANFQFQHTLPPAYQKFSKGSGLYT